MLISVTAVCTCASPSISYILRCWSPSCARGHSIRSDRGSFCFFPTLTSASRDGKDFFFIAYPPQPPTLGPRSVSCQDSRWKSMHHFSPAPGFDIDKSGCYGTATALVRWLELHWRPTALFSSYERSAAGMDLQDKCRCVCVRESSGTKRPFQSADGMEKVSIMWTSNQSKTKAHVKKMLRLWGCNCSSFLAIMGRLKCKWWVWMQQCSEGSCLSEFFLFCFNKHMQNQIQIQHCMYLFSIYILCVLISIHLFNWSE